MKKLISLLLAIVLTLSVFTITPFSVGAVEKDFTKTSAQSGNFEYTVLSDNTAEITDYLEFPLEYPGYEPVSKIPSTLDGYTITSIAKNSFRDCDTLTEITIPESVTSIGESAFEDCSNLRALTLSDSVTIIDKYAFYRCSSLTSVTISPSVTTIGDRVFSNCTSLTEISIPDSVTSIGNCAFLYCSSLESISIYNPDCSIGISSIPEETTICGYVGSTAEQYAKKKGNEFVKIISGDVDDDGEISIIDATLIQIHIADIKALTNEELSRADVDKDTAVSVIDATQIQRFVAQLIDKF